jgi:hypothetical protein
MIIFEGDYVRLTNESHWLRVDEIVFVDADPANNKLRLSDDYVVPAPIEKYIEEYRSENEQMEAYAEEVREQEERAAPTADKWEETYYASDAIHHAEANQY